VWVLAPVQEEAPQHHLPQTCRHHPLLVPPHPALLLLLLLLVGLLLLRAPLRRWHQPAVCRAAMKTGIRLGPSSFDSCSIATKDFTRMRMEYMHSQLLHRRQMASTSMQTQLS
jgi:hypothetical protein